jgi:hypothetical protein
MTDENLSKDSQAGYKSQTLPLQRNSKYLKSFWRDQHNDIVPVLYIPQYLVEWCKSFTLQAYTR